MDKTAMNVIELVSCAVNGKVPDKAKVEAMDLDAVYDFAASHTLTSAVAFALESAGYRDHNSSKAIGNSVHNSVSFDFAWAKIKEKLENAGIWYMPLKGAVLKKEYPKVGMREFLDYDILIDPNRADDVKAIMEELGYQVDHFGFGNDDRYLKSPNLIFEMHRDLFVPYEAPESYKYYQNIKNRLIGDGLEKHFRPEDFYLYLLAHEHKHYIHSGTGLRSLLDFYVILKTEQLDMDYIAAEAEKLGIKSFEKQNRTLALHLFGGSKLIETEQQMLNYLLSSGTYGSFGQKISNRLHSYNCSKFQYLLRRFCGPLSKNDPEYAPFWAFYPFFHRHKILLPFLPIYRLFRGMMNGKLWKELRAVLHASKNSRPD